MYYVHINKPIELLLYCVSNIPTVHNLHYKFEILINK